MWGFLVDMQSDLGDTLEWRMDSKQLLNQSLILALKHACPFHRIKYGEFALGVGTFIMMDE